MNDAAKLADEIAIEDKSTFSNAEWELIVTGLRSLAYPEARAIDYADEPLREMCIDYRNAHPLHAEGCFQRIVQFFKTGGRSEPQGETG